jgi:transposase
MPTLVRMLAASPEQRALLERWERAASTPQSLALRARIILRSLAGATSRQIGKDLEVSQPTIRRWQRRFRAGGPEAITEIAPGRGRKPTYGARKVKRII